MSSAPLDGLDKPVEEEKEAPAPPAPEPTPAAAPQKTNTLRVPPENLVEVLKNISESVIEIEASLGLESASRKPTKKKQKIDVVLGAQWGDEGKGKLVDMLSQVRTKIADGWISFSAVG